MPVRMIRTELRVGDVWQCGKRGMRPRAWRAVRLMAAEDFRYRRACFRNRCRAHGLGHKRRSDNRQARTDRPKDEHLCEDAARRRRAFRSNASHVAIAQKTDGKDAALSYFLRHLERAFDGIQRVLVEDAELHLARRMWQQPGGRRIVANANCYERRGMAEARDSRTDSGECVANWP